MLHKKIHLLPVIMAVFLFTTSANIIAQETITVSENLMINKINDHSYVHISYFTSSTGSKYACNGFIYTNDKEAYIFDTPANDQASIELINWLQKEVNVKIKGVVFNHFHVDCVEGMDIFQENGIPCIASKKTSVHMQAERLDPPDQLFEDELKLKLGNTEVINKYYGEAHTKDNIISYFPTEQLIYGGCMIKSLNASKGNLNDANVEEWSKTVSKIKKAYPKIKVVIPGHGDYGNSDLLDYTISLFKIEN